MAIQKLGEFVRGAYEKLRGLAAASERRVDEEAAGFLASLQGPVLPAAAAALPMEYPEEPVADGALGVADAEAAKLWKAGDVLAEAEWYDLAERLTSDANKVRSAVTSQDGKR